MLRQTAEEPASWREARRFWQESVPLIVTDGVDLDTSLLCQRSNSHRTVYSLHVSIPELTPWTMVQGQGRFTLRAYDSNFSAANLLQDNGNQLLRVFV
jgi:hypothetical protein